MSIFNVEFLVFCFQLAAFTNGAEPAACVIELECAECIPENMPLVTSHRAAGGVVRVAPGAPVALSCGAGKFLAFPLRGSLAAHCEAGRYRLPGEAAPRHLLELGCQENVYEDALHHVERCPPPLQGRSYQRADGSAHVAALCYDPDRGVAVRAHASNAPGNALPLAAHAHRSAPLTLLGNLNHMFDAKTRRDAERLFADDERMNRRLRELLRFQPFPFAGQALTSARLLSPHYFEDQNMRVADFASNRVAAWRSVAAGNLRLLHEDVAELMRASRPQRLDVYAGTLGVASLRPEGEGEGPRTELHLGAERRFPVPRYVWTVVHAAERGQAAALVLLNDPFVAVSEIRGAVFCDSVCSQLPYLAALRRHRAFECPLFGLVFCCDVAGLAARVPGLPPGLLNVTAGARGLLADLSPPGGPGP